MTYRLVIIFAEDPNDAQALEHLLRHLVRDVGVVRKPRRPLVLMKGRALPAVRSAAKRMADAISWEATINKRKVDLVIAHEDCDAVEPAHLSLASRMVTALRDCGASKTVAAVPAWELETWWYLWPDAVSAVCPGWRRLTRTGAIGMLTNAKEQLRRDLRPTGHHRIPDYNESDAPRIAARVREQGGFPKAGVKCASYDAFRITLTS